MEYLIGIIGIFIGAIIGFFACAILSASKESLEVKREFLELLLNITSKVSAKYTEKPACHLSSIPLYTETQFASALVEIYEEAAKWTK